MIIHECSFRRLVHLHQYETSAGWEIKFDRVRLRVGRRRTRVKNLRRVETIVSVKIARVRVETDSIRAREADANLIVGEGLLRVEIEYENAVRAIKRHHLVLLMLFGDISGDTA